MNGIIVMEGGWTIARRAPLVPQNRRHASHQAIFVNHTA